MKSFKCRRKTDTVPVVLEEGRWTYEKEGETPSQAMRRLEAGGPDVEPFTYEMRRSPHFKQQRRGSEVIEGLSIVATIVICWLILCGCEQY